MSAVQKFATDAIAPPERLRFWNGLVDRIYGGTYVNSLSEDFAGEMWTWRVGDLDMIRPRSNASMVGRQPHYTDEERVILHLQCRGTSQHRQGAMESILEPGDFVLGSPHTSYLMNLSAHELLVVEFPRAPLAERFPGLDDLMSRRLCGRSPGGRVFQDFLRSLWHQGEHSVEDADWADGVNHVFYDLVALAMRGANRPAEAVGDTGLKRKVLALVETQLCDPELRTVGLAQACNTSVRTIQNMFAAMGKTPSGYIVERRLQRAADRLNAAPATSITELAFELGFNDSAYFARCFRQKFGVAPRDWRRR